MNPLLTTWILLSLITLVSLWLDAALAAGFASTVVLVLAFFKARCVLMVFMEVQAAPPVLRWCCEAWVVVACALLITGYWLSVPA